MTTPPTTVSAVLLVDRRIQGYETIVSAVKPDVRCIVFDANQVGEICSQQSITSFQYILNKITELGITTFSNIGIVQHNFKQPFHQFFGSNSSEYSTVASVESSDPSLQTWAGVASFITTLKSTYGVQNVDLMACALYSNPDWKYIIDHLSSQTGVVIRASTDDTGAAELGGNWYLESHTGANLKGVYFTDAIDTFTGLLDMMFGVATNTQFGWNNMIVAPSTLAVWGNNLTSTVLSTTISAKLVNITKVFSNALFANGVNPTFGYIFALDTSGVLYGFGNNTFGSLPVNNIVNVQSNSGFIDYFTYGGLIGLLKSNGTVSFLTDEGANSAYIYYSTYTASNPIAAYNLTLLNADPNRIFGVLDNNSTFRTYNGPRSIATTGFASGDAANTITNVARVTMGQAYSTIRNYVLIKRDRTIADPNNEISWTNVANVYPLPGAYYGVVIFGLDMSNNLLYQSVGNGYDYNNIGMINAPSAARTNVVTVKLSHTATLGHGMILQLNGNVTCWNKYVNAVQQNDQAVNIYYSKGSIIDNFLLIQVSLKYDGTLYIRGDYGSNTYSSQPVIDVAIGVKFVAFLLNNGNVILHTSSNTFVTVVNTNNAVGLYLFGENEVNVVLNNGSLVRYYNGSITYDTSVVTYNGSTSQSNTILNSNVAGVVATLGLQAAAIQTSSSLTSFTNLDKFQYFLSRNNRRMNDFSSLNGTYTISDYRSLTLINPFLDSTKSYKLLIPDYQSSANLSSSPYNIKSNITIGSSVENFITAIDEGEQFTINGDTSVTYVLHHPFVYTVTTSPSFALAKVSSITTSYYTYTIYGDGGFSGTGSPMLGAPSLSNFTISTRTDTSSFNLTAPTTTNNVSPTFTYTVPAGNSVATISGSTVTIVGAGSVTVTATQSSSNGYASGTITATLTVNGITPTYNPVSPSVSVTKTYGVDVSFSMTSLMAGISNSSGAYTFSTASGAISISGGIATIVAYTPSAITITASQATAGNYASGSTSISLLINRGTPAYQSVAQIAKTYGTDASFSLATVMSGVSSSSGAYAFSVDPPVTTRILSTNNMNTITSAVFNGGQYQSNLVVAYAGNLAGWTEAGSSTVCLVDISNVYGSATNTPNYAIMFWVDNVITQTTAVSNSNVTGTQYTVNYKAGPAVYQASGQATQATASDGIVFEVLRANNTVLATSTYLPGAWAGYPTLTPSSFTYTGDGSGDVRVRIKTVSSGTGRFGGCVDDVVISNEVSTPAVVTISGDTANIVGVGNTTIFVSQDASGNYLASTTTLSLAVDRATPTFQSVAQITKTYRTDVSFSMTPIVAGMSNSDGAYIFTTSGSAVGVIDICGAVVTILAYTPSAVNIDVYQEASGNYTYRSGTISLLVARKVPTYGAFTPPTKTFGDASFSMVSYAPTTDSSGVALTYTSSAPSVATISSDGTVVTVIGNGSATITASQAANGNYAAGSTTGVLTVNRIAPTFLKAFTITDKTFGDAAFSLLPFTDGLDNTDGTYHFSSSNPSIVSISTVDNVTATILAYTPTPITITVDIDACGNYAAATTSGTLTVARAAPTYQSVSQVAKTYGVDASFSLTSVMSGISNSSGAYTFTSGSDAISISGAVATILAYTPSAITITASQAASGNYLAGSKTFTLLVSNGGGSPPTYQAVSQISKTYGVDASFSLATVMSGVSNSDGAYTFSSASDAISISGNVATILGYTPSAITITASQDASGNYQAGSKALTLLVGRGTPTYQSVSQVTKTYGVDVSFSMTALVAGISNSDGAYTFSSASGAVSISGAVVTILGYTPSAISITATQAASGNYAASSTTVSLLVGRGTPSYQSVSQVAKTYGVDSSFSLTAVMSGISNSSGAYSFSSDSGAIDICGGVATILEYTPSAVTVTASQDASGNYSASSTSFSVLVGRGTPTYQSVSQITKTYGTDVSFSLASVVAGISNSGGAYTFSSGSGAISITGDVLTILAYTPSAVSITATQAAAGNYIASSTTLSLLVDRAAPTYQSVSLITKTFGVDISFSLAAVVAGISNSDGAYSLFSSASGAVSISGNVVTILGYTSSAITITASQDASGNYASSSKSISLLVNRGTPAYQSVAQIAKTYGTDVSFSLTDVMVGASNSSGAYTFSTSASADLISISGAVVTINAYTPSAVTITASQAASGNYTESSTTVTLLVDRKVPSYGTFTLPAVTFEDAPYSLVSSAPTSQSNAAYSYTSSNTAVATVNSDGTVVTVIGQGYTTITASQDISGNYAAGSTTASLLVNRAAPTFLKAFTITDKTFGDASFSLLPFTVGLDNTDGTYHFSSSNASVVSISEADGVTATILAYSATPVTIYVAIDACGNYAASTTSGTLTVNRAAPAYQSVSTVSKTFGDAAFSLTPYMSGISESSGSYTFASSDVSAVSIGGDGVTATILAYTASAITITATQAASGNYVAGTKTFSMTVDRAAPTIGALGLGTLNGYYDVSDGYFTLTAPTSNSSGGFTYSSDNSAVAMIVNTNNVSFIGNGTANISATQDICGNYSTGSVSSLLRVGATVPTFGTFTVSSTERTYGDGAFTLTPPTSNSDGAFTFTSSNSSIVSISGTTATIVGGGSVNITVSQVPSGSFTRKSVTTAFTIQRKNPNLRNFPSIVISYDDGSFRATAPDTDGPGSFIYSSSNTGIVDNGGGSSPAYSIYSGGSTTITATQAATQNYASSSITATVTITPVLPYTASYSNFSRAFDVGTFTVPRISTISSGAVSYVSSDTSVATISGTTVTIRKVGETTITATIAATTSHLTRDISAVFTVTRGTPTISGLSDQTLTMTQAPFTLSPTSSSNGTFSYVSDNSAVVFMTNSGTTFNVASVGTATITATITQDASANYDSRNYSFTMLVIRATSNLSTATFTVPNSMTYGDVPVSIIAAPSSLNSDGSITYLTTNSSKATVNSTTGVITAVGEGYVNFIASQAQTAVYNSSILYSNYIYVARKTVTQTRVTPYTSSTLTKYYGDASFQLVSSSESTGSIMFSLSNSSVATLSSSSNTANITITNVGSVVVTASQFANSRYSTQNDLTWTLTVEKGTTALTGLAATLSKNVTDAPFTVAVTSASGGAKSYALSNPDSSNVLVVNSSTGVVTLKGAGTATIVASQATSSLYNAPSSVSCVVTVAAAGSALQGSTITSTRVFDNVDMSGASLSGTTVTGVSFAGATMVNAVLTGATVRNATLTSTNMVGATLANADVSGTSFAGATMTRIIMTGTTLSNSTLTSTDLSGATMTNAIITGTSFADSTMTNAVLTGATLTNSTLTSTVLTGASLVRANVTGSTFVGASLAGADLSGATVTNANFTNANISGANITNVDFSPLQKIQLLKNTNNRAIGGIQVGDISGSVILSAISETSPAASIPNIATAVIKVVIPTTSTVLSDTLPNVALDTTAGDKFYFPINEGEYFQILGVKYYTSSGIVKNAVTNETVQVISYGNKSIWLIAGSIIASVLATNTLSESTFTVPSGKLDTDAPFNISVAPTSNSDAAIVYSSNHTSVATIHPSTGVITIVKQGYVSFVATQDPTLLYEAGSKTSNELYVNKLINFTLSGLNQTILMSTSGSLDGSSSSLETTDATAVFYVKVSDLTNVFKIQTDSNDMSDTDASDVKYYVFNRMWPAALKINPAHAMLNKTESNGMLGTTDLFSENKMLAKHDFLRYLSLRLFNTIYGVDLFSNESDLLENTTYWGENVSANIHDIMASISTTSSDETMSYDASGNKYLTDAASGNTNLCRELVRQLTASAASRFSSIVDANSPQGIPLMEDDSINFKVTFNSAPSQNVLTGVTEIPSRSYMVRLVLKNSITGLNTPVIDSEMYSNAYPYSSSVVSYAPTSESSAVYNSYSPPAPVPFARFGFDGWYYTNSTAWVTSTPRNHIKWLLPANSGSSTVGSLLYIRANLKIHNKVALPYIMVYTQSNSWRKYPVTNTGALVNGTAYSFYVNFNSYTREPAMIGYTNAVMSNTTGGGSFGTNELILNIALETDGGAATGTVDFTLSSVVIGDASGEKEYGFEADVPAAYP